MKTLLLKNQNFFVDVNLSHVCLKLFSGVDHKSTKVAFLLLGIMDQIDVADNQLLLLQL